MTVGRSAGRPNSGRRTPEAELIPPLGSLARALERRPLKLGGAMVAAVVGTALGVAGALVTGRSSEADAALIHAASLDLRDAPLTAVGNVDRHRSHLIAEILTAGEPERLSVNQSIPAGMAGKTPKLVIIFDDMGVDRRAFNEVMGLPGPVTLSFLPYGNGVQAQADKARARGDDILLHLPMEPGGGADPGPQGLEAGMSPEDLFKTLEWNLAQFDGYVGVNNHMGSKFTRNEQAMKRVLATLEQRGLFFIDSLTTADSMAAQAGAAVGAEVFVRDVFLDAEPGREVVRRQLGLAEEIAAKTGYAIVICHPRAETLDMIGPWLTTALARGYELATVSSLRDLRRAS